METTKPSDPTFRSYNAQQAQSYAISRTGYAVELYDMILNHHYETKGEFGSLLDVGCGPGNATRDLALAFDQAVGIDPGAEMIATATRIGGKTRIGNDIQFEISPAEECSKVEGINAESVDLLTAAMAAHWFNMQSFWSSAAEVLKPGGTIALWTCSSLYCHPSTPNAAEVQRVLFRLERETLAPYELPFNRISRDMYDNLVLPWHVSPHITAFPQQLLVRQEWDRDGILSDQKGFFGGGKEISLEHLEKDLSTASMVTRWRAASPELAGTDEDCVRKAMSDIKKVLGDQETFIVGHGTAILLLKKQI